MGPKWPQMAKSRLNRTASAPNSLLVLRCMWKEPALLRIASSAVCKINQHNQWVVCEGKSCVKTCSRCYCGLPSGSSGDHIFIWYLDYHDFHGHHEQSSYHRQHNHYSHHDHHAISSSATCKRWTASLPRTTARSSSPFPSTSSRNSALPNKPRERCVFLGPRGPLVLPSIGLT